MDIRYSKLSQAMNVQMNRNSVVANNLANVNSNGFKRDVMFSELLSKRSGESLDSQVATDHSQGGLTQTDNPLDCAISGEGFFTVDNGQDLVFTRDGHFNHGADGILRTSSGFAVMGQTGWIDVGAQKELAGNIRIDMNGDIFVADEYIDRLEISSFEDLSKLKKIGDNLFQAEAGMIENRVENPVILQGKIEGSNVAAIHEMVELIELQRSFESSQKALTTLDEAQGKAANSIGSYR